MDKLNIMLVKNLKKEGFGFCPSMGPGASSANLKSAWVANKNRKPQAHGEKRKNIDLRPMLSKRS